MIKTGYFAHREFEAELEKEIAPVSERYGRLFLTEGAERASLWSQNIWRNPTVLEIKSIKDAANQLRNLQRNWALYDFHLHRRAGLIQENLPHVSAKRLVYLAPPPKAPLGSWTLLDETHVLASAECSSPYWHGEMEFVEDKDTPPNRAYLKLWEFFTRTGTHPSPHDLCLDLGSSPGGWTWVLANLGCRVISVDKAPLAPEIAAMPGVTYRAQSAFALDPIVEAPVDWLFSDVICYPERLLTLVKRWIDADKAKNLVCTIKFQAETDYNALAAFAAVPGSTICHQYHNKHEVTWSRLATR